MKFSSGYLLIAMATCAVAKSAGAADPGACPDANAGLTLPPGFCASVFADELGHARHLVAAANGVVYVNTRFSRSFAGARRPDEGLLVALQDSTGAGRADVIERFGDAPGLGAAGGTGIGLYNGALYAEAGDAIVRYTLSPGSIVPKGPAVPVVTGLPQGGDHPMHPFVIDAQGFLYVDVASATNSCQLSNRTPNSPGAQPCTELATRGGIWRYQALRDRQAFSPAERYATGIRNAEGFAVDGASHRIFVTQHGRDQLHANWPTLYQAEEEATLPAEELLRLEAGADYGWPECYFDPFRGRLVLAPEYGGNGGERIGVCADKTPPIAAFPAHWAPNAMVFYAANQFPARYRGGVFIAFHGSWDRAPYPQQGYNVVFQSLRDDGASAHCEIFADGFAGGVVRSPAEAQHRPSGVAVGPDGSLYVSDDARGRIYRITYRGAPATPAGAAAADTASAAGVRPCPSAATPVARRAPDQHLIFSFLGS